MKPWGVKCMSLTFGVETCEWKRLDRRSCSRRARLRCQQYMLATERRCQCENCSPSGSRSPGQAFWKINFVALSHDRAISDVKDEDSELGSTPQALPYQVSHQAQNQLIDAHVYIESM